MGAAVDCAFSIAAGRLPGSPPIEDEALKLVMNVTFPKNSDCVDKVVESATKELELATRFSIDNNRSHSPHQEQTLFFRWYRN